MEKVAAVVRAGSVQPSLLCLDAGADDVRFVDLHFSSPATRLLSIGCYESRAKGSATAVACTAEMIARRGLTPRKPVNLRTPAMLLTHAIIMITFARHAYRQSDEGNIRCSDAAMQRCSERANGSEKRRQTGIPQYNRR